jgi:hypothetical protein
MKLLNATIIAIALYFIISYYTALFAQDTTGTHKILLTFNEPMDLDGVLNKLNYTVFDDGLNEINIKSVGANGSGDSVVVFVDWLNYKTDFAVRVYNVKDTSGNIIGDNNTAWFYFDGYNPNEPPPYLIIK